jgi:hypothetical protein
MVQKSWQKNGLFWLEIGEKTKMSYLKRCQFVLIVLTSLQLKSEMLILRSV